MCKFLMIAQSVIVFEYNFILYCMPLCIVKECFVRQHQENHLVLRKYFGFMLEHLPSRGL